MTHPRYQIQIVRQPFSGRVPEHLWRPYGHATTKLGAWRVLRRAAREVTPQPRAWSGHVRVIDLETARRVGFEREYSGRYTVRTYDLGPIGED